MRDRTRGLLALCAWVALLSGALVLLHRLGGGSLGGPPLLDPGRLPDWLASRSAQTAAFAALRLLATVVAWYLLGTTVATGAARLLGWARAAALVDKLSVRLVRNLVAVLGTASLGAATTASPSWAGQEPGASAGGAVVVAPPPVSANPGGGPGAAVMRRLPDGRRGGTAGPPGEQRRPPAEQRATRPEGLPGAPPAKPPVSAGEPAQPPPATWVTRPDDSLWSIAAAALEQRLGRPPSDEEVEPYWQELISQNRSRLEDPADPDLIFPGQVFLLPQIPGSGPTAGQAGPGDDTAAAPG
jgi:hypothetical protein